MPDITTAEWTFLLYMDSPDDEQIAADRALLQQLATLARWGPSFNFIYEIGIGDLRERGRLVNETTAPLQNVPRTGPIADAITSFVDWAEETFPSRYTALSLRDHGSLLAPAPPLSPRARSWLVPTASAPRPNDEPGAKEPVVVARITGNGKEGGGQALDGRGIRTALSRTKKGRVDVYCFDACSMGMLEFAYEVRKVAKYIVASELIIDVDAFPYEPAVGYAAGELPSGPLGMAVQIANANPGLFAVIDTAWLETLASAVGRLGKYLDAQPLPSIIELRDAVPPTADSGVDLKQLLGATLTTFADDPTLVSLVERIETTLRHASPSYGQPIVKGEPASGLALSFPDAKTIGYMLGYAGLAFGRETEWAGFLFDYIPALVDRYVYTLKPAG